MYIKKTFIKTGNPFTDIFISCFQLSRVIYNQSKWFIFRFHIPVTMSDIPRKKEKKIYVFPEEGQVQHWEGLQLFFFF